MRRPRSRARSSTSAAAIALALGVAHLAWPLQPVLAILSENEVVQSTFTTTSLHAPTGLSASAALLLRVNLSWTATTDARATGYQVLRGTANGGPYSQVGTVAGKATTTYQDNVPLPGTYYYVLRTYYDSWASANSNQAQLIAA
jgi:hypothetical protein